MMGVAASRYAIFSCKSAPENLKFYQIRSSDSDIPITMSRLLRVCVRSVSSEWDECQAVQRYKRLSVCVALKHHFDFPLCNFAYMWHVVTYID